MARLKITQVKSRIGATAQQRKISMALGLRKIRQSVEHEDSVDHQGHAGACEAPRNDRGG